MMLSAFHGGLFGGLRSTLIAAVLAVFAVALAWVPTAVEPEGIERATLDTVIGGLVLVSVCIVPFFMNRSHIEPRQFAGFPVTPGALATSLLLTSVVSWTAVLLGVWLASFLVFRPELWADPLAVVFAVVLVVCLAVVTARLASATSKLLIGQRWSGALRTVGVVLGIAVLPLLLFAFAGMLGGRDITSTVTDAARVLGWSPFGAPFAAMHLAAEGELSAALSRLAITLAAIIVGVLLWVLVARRSLASIDRPLDPSVARHGLGWFERFAPRPGAVIGARALTYWSRDPRYRVALLAIPAAPILMLVALAIAGVDHSSLALIPLPVMLFLLGWSLHNDVAMDSTAIWMHVASGVRGRYDRLGRLVPVVLVGLPVLLIGLSLTVTFLGDWRVLPALAGMNIAVFLIAAGVAGVFSAVKPYPATRPGDSPFAQPAGAGTGAAAAQTASFIVAAALCAAPVWVSMQAVRDVELLSNVWALAFGVGYGLVVLALGVFIGGKLFDRRGPELLAATQMFD